MIVRNVTESEMNEALRLTNVDYQNNVLFKTFAPKGNGYTFTLRVASSKGLGHRISHMGRRIPSACWHVHRDFMKNLFNLNPNAKIISCHAVYDGIKGFENNYLATGYKNIGSIMQPLSFADACEC